MASPFQMITGFDNPGQLGDYTQQYNRSFLDSLTGKPPGFDFSTYTPQGTAQQAAAPNLDEYGQDRNRLGQLFSQYGNLAAGRGPSLAGGQLQSGLQQAQQQTLGLANNRSVNPGLALYGAQNAMGNAGAQAAGNAANLVQQQKLAAMGAQAGLGQGMQQGALNAANLGQQNQQFNAQQANQMNQLFQQLLAQQNAQKNQINSGFAGNAQQFNQDIYKSLLGGGLGAAGQIFKMAGMP